VLKTYLWINDTANSNKINNNKPPKVKIIRTLDIKAMGPLINTISKCPATILAASRTERVIGRITVLTISIRTINGIRI